MSGAAQAAAPAAGGGATPFPEGDPRNAKYFENLAALEHTLNNTLAGDQQSLQDAQAAYDYNTGALARQLPLTLQGTRNTANSNGLLESGQLAKQTGTVEAQYAAKRGEARQALQSAENKAHQNEQAAREALQLGQSNAAQTAREEALKQTEEEAPDEQAAATTAPPRVVAQQPQPTTGGQRARGRNWRQQHPQAVQQWRQQHPQQWQQRQRRRAAQRAAKTNGNGGTRPEVG